jgi:phosphopantothenoylcysteine decarboxylase
MPEDRPLADYEILVGVCGGISAYKVCSVVSALVQQSAGVTVAMSRAARNFVHPLTFQSLTGRQVFTSLWSSQDYYDPQHIKLTEAADIFLIAPATAHMIGRIAHGLADDLISTMVMSADCPVVLAPAMNTRMWQNGMVQQNVTKLSEYGYRFIGPEEGWLACRTVGAGRMAEPDAVVNVVRQQLRLHPPRKRTNPPSPGQNSD